MRFGMAHSLVLFAEKVVATMFFTGLAGCVSVVVVSWISIFKDGFANSRKVEVDADWESQHHISPAKTSSASPSMS